MIKFIKILEDNWYDNKQILKGVSIQELTEIGIPHLLAKKINEKVNFKIN